VTPQTCVFLTHSQPKDCGDYRHRILWPATALGDYIETLTIQMTHPRVIQIAATADILVICMAVENVLEKIIKFRTSYGLPTIYEISDDFQSFPANSQLAPFYAQYSIRLQLIGLAKICQATQFSSPFLKRKYNYINPTSTVFMNQVWEIPQQRTSTTTQELQIGWTASGGHISDAMEMGPMVTKALSGLPKNTYWFSAMTTPKVIEALQLSGLKVAHKNTGPWEEYLSYLTTLDVGLAHIGEEDFAQGRSDGKYIEYASRGVVAICKKGGTYQYTIRSGENGFLYETTEDLLNIFKRLINEPNLLDVIRSNAYQDLKDNRNHSVAARERLDFYSSLCERPISSSKTGFKDALDPVELELMALMEEQNENPSKGLIPKYQKLIKGNPDAYQPWYYLYHLFTKLQIHKKKDWLKHRFELLQELALKEASLILDKRSETNETP
jgi:hypothetical protein